MPVDSFIPSCDIEALGPYPILRLLLTVDAQATLDVVAAAFQVGG